MADSNERVAGGALPDWEVAELPRTTEISIWKSVSEYLRSRHYRVRRFYWER